MGWFTFKRILLFLPLAAIIVAIGAFAVFFSFSDNGELLETAMLESTQIRKESVEVDDTKPDVVQPEKSTLENSEVNTKDGEFKLIAVGDVLLGRGVEENLKLKGQNYIYPFEKVAGILKKGDIIFGNLEEPITDSPYSLADLKKGDPKGKYILRNRTESFEGIKYAGFNLMNIANNHILDFYEAGLFDTMNILKQNNIAYVGAGRSLEDARKPAIIEKNGVKVGFVSYTSYAEVVYKGNPPLSFLADKDKSGVAPIKFEYIKEDVEKLKGSVDIIMVSLHWGTEYEYMVDKWQIDLAHKIMDLGVDIIIGHHPHRLKGIETYKGKPIVYSLGNFLSDQNDPHNQESFILDIDFAGNKIKSFNAIPFIIVDKSQVVPVTGGNAKYLLDKISELSTELNSKCTIENDKIAFDFN